MVEKDKVRSKIISQACIIFRKFGYKKTTMDDIARSTKKGKSSIYYYFKGKEDIYNAVVLREASYFRQAIMQAISSGKDPYDKLKRYVLTRMNTIPLTSNFHNALKIKDVRDSEFIVRLNKIYDHEEIRLFKIILKEGVENNYFMVNDIDLAATAIVMAMRGMESRLMEEEIHEVYIRRLDEIIQIIFYGIVNRESTFVPAANINKVKENINN